MAVNVVVVRNPQALAMPDLLSLIRRSLEGMPLCPGGLESCIDDLVAAVLDPGQGLLVGVEDGKMLAVGLVGLPQGNMAPYPWILHFYNEGSSELREALHKGLLDFCRVNGYVKAWAINTSGRSDGAWARVVVPKGVKAEPIGTAHLLDASEVE